MLLKAALAASLLTSCASTTNHYNVVLDPSVDEQTWRTVDSALGEWTDAAPEMSFDVYRGAYPHGERNTIILYRVHEQHEAWAGLTSTQPSTGGALVWLTDEGVRPDIVAHEIGHAMGLMHQACGVMVAVTPYVEQTVQCCDVRQLCAVRELHEAWCECH